MSMDTEAKVSIPLKAKADYPGRESDGIIHMTTTCLDNTLTYIVFRTDKKHPKPFSFEYDPTNDFQVAG